MSDKDMGQIILKRIRKRVNSGVTDFRTIYGDGSDVKRVGSALKGLRGVVEACILMLPE